MDELTKEQQCVMKPWVITAAVATIVRLIALCLFCVYLAHARPVNYKIITLWLAAIIFIPHFFVSICLRHITKIKGIERHEGLWILATIAIALIATLSYFTW